MGGGTFPFGVYRRDRLAIWFLQRQLPSIDIHNSDSVPFPLNGHAGGLPSPFGITFVYFKERM